VILKMASVCEDDLRVTQTKNRQGLKDLATMLQTPLCLISRLMALLGTRCEFVFSKRIRLPLAEQDVPAMPVSGRRSVEMAGYTGGSV